MPTMVKNVLVVDGSGWLPFWGNLIIEDAVIKEMAVGENVLISKEPLCDKVLGYKPGDFPGKTAPEAYLIPGLKDGMTMADYQAELDQIIADLKTGTKIETAFRKLTGFGTGQREFLKQGSTANFMIVDKPATKILTAFTAGKEL